MCSDKSIEEAPFTKTTHANSDNFNEEELRKFEKENEIENKKRIIITRKEVTYNAYELVYSTFDDSNITFEEIYESLDEVDSYGILSFFLIMINSVFILIYSFLSKLRIVNILNKINIVLITSSLIFFFLKNGLLEDINQIKIGYYLFFLNSIGIIYFCNKELKKTQ
ncbi:hypothetical protein [Flavobacterium sp. H122]|uniref:hypothetical protein n=1 Tax=Flavobacterium sp. H122 TaxID=2529860 RepID=UPI0010AA747D|nr:hypothetical protein [Flavobacterium sp. H122]